MPGQAQVAMVLILEDEALIALDVEAALQEAGFATVVTGSRADANEFLVAHRPDAAVLDIRLSDGDCVMVAERLLELGVPFVVHSGAARHDQHPIFSFGKPVGKPADPREIVGIVRSLLPKPLNDPPADGT